MEPGTHPNNVFSNLSSEIQCHGEALIYINMRWKIYHFMNVTLGTLHNAAISFKTPTRKFTHIRLDTKFVSRRFAGLVSSLAVRQISAMNFSLFTSVKSDVEGIAINVITSQGYGISFFSIFLKQSLSSRKRELVWNNNKYLCK